MYEYIEYLKSLKFIINLKILEVQCDRIGADAT